MRAIAVAGLLALGASSGCGDASAPAGASAPEEVPSSPAAIADDTAPLRGGLASLDAIGEVIVGGLNRRDEAALRSVLVDPRDFKGPLFAALSNHASAAQMGPDLIWELQRRESDDELARASARFGGQELRFVTLRGEREARGGVVLHRRPQLIVEDRAGERRELAILASLIEHPASQTFVLLAYKVGG